MTTDGKGARELAAILSGGHAPAGRAALHSALDAILDAAATDGGRLDAAAFWGFVGELARGRGIADEIADAAAVHVTGHGGLPDALAEAWQAVQWAVLSAALTRLDGAGSILPTEFSAAAFRAVADNVQSGTGGGEAQDLLGLRTQRGTADNAEGRAARRLLVGAVFFRAEKTGKSVAATRRAILPPDLADGTWKDWTREVARTKRVAVPDVGQDARAAARGEAGTDPTVYDLDADAIARLLRVAWRPNA